ncbi:MAG: ATP-dependent protease, partial [Clostridiaceae bacterium]|nr:ATP-dependent protease [Clostridiaceae bacterium]
GLDGSQGVIIPARNKDSLMLKRELVEAVRDGQFNLYAVHTVEEGIELLTGMPAGQKDAYGQYPPETVFGRVSQKLQRYQEKLTALNRQTQERNDA